MASSGRQGLGLIELMNPRDDGVRGALRPRAAKACRSRSRWSYVGAGQVRSGAGYACRGVRRPERARLQRPAGGGCLRPGRGRDKYLIPVSASSVDDVHGREVSRAPAERTHAQTRLPAQGALKCESHVIWMMMQVLFRASILHGVADSGRSILQEVRRCAVQAGRVSRRSCCCLWADSTSSTASVPWTRRTCSSTTRDTYSRTSTPSAGF